LLGKVQEILAASDRLDRAASQLGGGMEPKLSVVWSDTYQSDRFEEMLLAFEQRFPDLEFECLIAEHGDLVSLVQTGRAHIGVVAAQSPPIRPTSARPRLPSSRKSRCSSPPPIRWPA
jgi:DNA-binding transcriptional LysR family regulator